MCMQFVEKGPCKQELERYYFETKTGKCKSFLFGGCFGNLNNFETLEECEATCHTLIENFMTAKLVPIKMSNQNNWNLAIIINKFRYFFDLEPKEMSYNQRKSNLFTFLKNLNSL